VKEGSVEYASWQSLSYKKGTRIQLNTIIEFPNPNQRTHIFPKAAPACVRIGCGGSEVTSRKPLCQNKNPRLFNPVIYYSTHRPGYRLMDGPTNEQRGRRTERDRKIRNRHAYIPTEKSQRENSQPASQPASQPVGQSAYPGKHAESYISR
jgi:hypothetical protein